MNSNPNFQHFAGSLSFSLPRLRGRRQTSKLAPLPMSILKTGRNCWRREQASRVGFVVDARDFYKAFYEAALRAEKQILIVGWDTDSRVELLVGDDRPYGQPVRLKKLLFDLCEARPDLNIYILSWNFNIVFSLEREVLSQMKFDWLSHERVHFVLDDTNSTLGSHHQKVVVVDDEIAFSGGLDICARRWDTPEHLAVDERRVDPWGKPYGPFHDVQIAVDGDAARALGDLVRERWRNATGEKLHPVRGTTDKWPPSLSVDLTDVEAAISRTMPAKPLTKPVLEVERLFIDSIARAQRFIFFENQYFSSKVIAKCLARRLREPDGPEIVMVLPRDATGFIEESTMSVLRARVLDIVREADVYGRFKIYHPIVPNLTKGYVKVHSKVTVIDDEFVRVGSANLNQRSMGLDSECDISIESKGEERVRRAIGKLRARLLSEHLGVDPKEFEARFAERGSLLATVESFRGGARTLVELERIVPEWLDIIVPESPVIDPSGPYRWRGGLRRYFPNFVAAISQRVPWLGRFKILTLAIIVMTLLLIWKMTPLDQFIRPESISEFFATMRINPITPLAVVGIFIIGSFLMIPLTAMVVATAFIFDAVSAFFLALGGTMAAAAATYALGHKFQRESVARLSNRWLRQVEDKIAVGGWMAVAVVRMIPVAPFTVVNLFAGSAQVPFRDFIVGTFAGTLPGILALTLLAGRISSALRSPDFRNVFLLSLLVLAILASMKMVKHFVIDRNA